MKFPKTLHIMSVPDDDDRDREERSPAFDFECVEVTDFDDGDIVAVYRLVSVHTVNVRRSITLKPLKQEKKPLKQEKKPAKKKQSFVKS